MLDKTRRNYRKELARLRITDYEAMLKDPATGAVGGDARQEITALLEKEQRVLRRLTDAQA